MLQTENTPIDLVFRGFSREVVLDRTGVDVGYNGRSLREEASGTDRVAYKIEHVRQRVDSTAVLAALDVYAAGADKVATLAALGLAGENTVKLKELFAGLGLADEFSHADRAHRTGVMRQGMLDKHGVANPFELEAVQKQAAETREERYGAAYTLASGSSLAEGARAKAASSSARSSAVLVVAPGSVEDMVLRGLTREEVFAAHGVDVGPRMGKGLGHLRGFDRRGYRVKRVRELCGDALIASVLEEIAADRLQAEGAASLLGLGPRGLNLGEVFEDLGLAEEWAAARRAAVSSRADRTKATNMARYGGISPMASAAVRAKVVATTQERHGVDNVSQLQATKDRKRAASRERYGTDSPLQAAEVQAKSRATVRDRYGVDNVSQSDEIKEKKRQISMERYGVSTPALDPGVRAKMAESLRASTPDLPDGATAPMQALSVRERAKHTHRERHGVDSTFELASTQQRIKETMVERYGASNPSLVEEHRERRTETIRERYGVDNAFQSEELMEGAQERAQRTMLERYGNASWSATDAGRRRLSEIVSSPSVQAASRATKHANGTFGTSAPEEALYVLLVERFGSDDVVRQHRDDVRYPFSCDFYIPSRDLFVELNGSWTHGGHWYDPRRTVDAKKLAKWQSKADDGSAYYANAIYVWTDLDARKREAACKHSLNYVVLWDGSEDLLDTHLWLSLGMPDGRDWEREYSWLEDRSLDASIPWPKALDERPRTAIAAARAANGEALYSRELAAWNADDVHARSWGRTRARILSNRLRHVGKTPDVLRDIEALRGFGISGALRAHTAFDNGGMVEVLEEFSPTRVYDPCAGWGERMATCAALGIEYLGVDINEAVVEGHARMAAQYGLSTQRTVHADAAQHDASGFDADLVFTCPPYGDVEIYTEHGAENLDDDAFLAWWGEVVDCSVGPSTEVFAFQVNQLWRDRMVAVLEDRGWRLEHRIDVGRGRVSHFNRASDGTSQKREFEQIQVLVRV